MFESFQNFTKDYAVPVEKGLTSDATAAQKSKSKILSEKLRNIYKPHFLRRTKRQIFKVKSVEATEEALNDDELPLKTDLVVWLDLSEPQKNMYEHIISREHVKSVLQSGAFMNAFCLLSCIKKLCQHPLLLMKGAMKNVDIADDFFGEEKSDNLKDDDDVEKESEKDTKIDDNVEEEKQTKMMKMLDLKDILNDAVKNYNENNLEGILNDSSKLVFLFKLLENLHKEGHKVLIFSMSKVMLNIIEKITIAAGEFKFRRIDGDTDIEERNKIQKEFNRDPKIFMWMLTTKVGGWGLNLIGADRVIIFDPDWNPANDNQAVDRLYRIGQKKDVIVYRLVTTNGIEERIYRRQIHKQGINKATVENNENKTIQKYFSNGDLFELFNFERDSDKWKTLEILKESEKNAGKVSNKDQSKQLKKHLKFLKGIDNVFGLSNNAWIHSHEEEEEEQDQNVLILDNNENLDPATMFKKSNDARSSKKKSKKAPQIEPKGENVEVKTRGMKVQDAKKTQKTKPKSNTKSFNDSDLNDSDLFSEVEDSMNPISALESIKQIRQHKESLIPTRDNKAKKMEKTEKDTDPTAKKRKRLKRLRKQVSDSE